MLLNIITQGKLKINRNKCWRKMSWLRILKKWDGYSFKELLLTKGHISPELHRKKRMEHAIPEVWSRSSEKEDNLSRYDLECKWFFFLALIGLWLLHSTRCFDLFLHVSPAFFLSSSDKSNGGLPLLLLPGYRYNILFGFGTINTFSSSTILQCFFTHLLFHGPFIHTDFFNGLFRPWSCLCTIW